MTTSNDLLVIGAGTLGRLIATEWRRLHPTSTIIGETASTNSHALLAELGITPNVAGQPTKPFPHIVFCLPPSAVPDYPAAASSALTRLAPEGRFVFTSSGGVHGPAKHVSEQTPVDDSTERTKRLANAERAILKHPRGNVLRLSGLYTAERGAHTFWIRRGEITGPADGTVNLIHYNDAARAAVKVLLGGDEVKEAEKEGKTFLAAAKSSTTRRGIVEAALKHPLFKDEQLPKMTDGNGGKTYDCEWTRQVLDWAPAYELFEDFMQADGAKRLESVSN